MCPEWLLDFRTQGDSQVQRGGEKIPCFWLWAFGRSPLSKHSPDLVRVEVARCLRCNLEGSGSGTSVSVFTKRKSPQHVNGSWSWGWGWDTQAEYFTGWILRCSTFNAQVEEFELTEEMETAAEGTEPGLWVGWRMGSEAAYFREDRELFSFMSLWGAKSWLKIIYQI